MDARKQAYAAEQEAVAAAAAERERQRQEARERRFEEVRASCPLPITADQEELPGGLTLFDDEFLVTVGKDWGWSSKKLILTTQRVIYAQGRGLGCEGSADGLSERRSRRSLP